jgi:hypothetical protein
MRVYLSPVEDLVSEYSFQHVFLKVSWLYLVLYFELFAVFFVCLLFAAVHNETVISFTNINAS